MKSRTSISNEGRGGGVCIRNPHAVLSVRFRKVGGHSSAKHVVMA